MGGLVLCIIKIGGVCNDCIVYCFVKMFFGSGLDGFEYDIGDFDGCLFVYVGLNGDLILIVDYNVVVDLIFYGFNFGVIFW